MNAQSILLRPIVTEKSVRLKDELNQVTFEVPRAANKIQIAQAVEELFKVRVLDVRTARVRGKIKGFGKRVRRRPDWKKAIVHLAEGQAIDFFAGV